MIQFHLWNRQSVHEKPRKPDADSLQLCETLAHASRKLKKATCIQCSALHVSKYIYVSHTEADRDKTTEK